MHTCSHFEAWRNDTSPESFLCTLPRLHLFPKSRVFGPKTAFATVSSAAGCTGKADGSGFRGPPASRTPPRPDRPWTHPVRVQVHLQSLSGRAQVGSLPQGSAARTMSSGCPPPASWGCRRSAASSGPSRGTAGDPASTRVSRGGGVHPRVPPPTPHRAAHLRAVRGTGCGSSAPGDEGSGCSSRTTKGSWPAGVEAPRRRRGRHRACTGADPAPPALPGDSAGHRRDQTLTWLSRGGRRERGGSG